MLRYRSLTCLLLALLLLPAAAALGASVVPEVVEPGDPVRIRFALPSASGPLGVLDAAALPRVTCTLTAPDGGTTTLCSRAGTVEVSLLGGSEIVTLQIAAPEEPGVYTVRVERSTATGLLGSSGASTAYFTVLSVADPAGDPEAAASEPAAPPPAPARRLGPVEGVLLGVAIGSAALGLVAVALRRAVS